jgi:hypothetical protein
VTENVIFKSIYYIYLYIYLAFGAGRGPHIGDGPGLELTYLRSWECNYLFVVVSSERRIVFFFFFLFFFFRIALLPDYLRDASMN